MESFEKYVGEVFDKRYRILKVIGIGGMAVVFEANDLLMRRNVAVKMLKADISNDAAAVKRFINESKAVSMLSHPNIVNIFDVSVKDNLKYIVMELVDGITLKNYILKKRVLSFGETIRITEQILLALHHAHSKGIVHRDIKPQNIMMLKNGVIKVADFGIAKLPNAETVTMTDKAIGTVFYISPEQASGKPIDRRSDIYALGVTMYEMVTGKLPFVSDNPVSVAIMQVKNRPKPPSEINGQIPKGLEQIILGAMEKNPDNRFQSAAQMLRHLQQIKSNPGTIFKMPKANENGQGDQSQKSQKLPSNVKKLNPQKRSSRSMFPVIAGVASAFLIVCIVAFCAMWPKMKKTMSKNDAKQIVIPNLVGAYYSDSLEKQLETSGYYNVEAIFEASSDENKGKILIQDPLPDEKRMVNPDDPDQKCELTLRVGLGIQEHKLPDYAYMEKRAVKKELQLTYQMQVREEEVSDEYIPEGYVVRTEPAAGENVYTGGTITLYVSSTKTSENNPVPNVVGKTIEDASSVLAARGFRIGLINEVYSDTYERGVVIKQDPAYVNENQTESKGKMFTLDVSLGPKASAEDDKAHTEEGDSNYDTGDVG